MNDFRLIVFERQHYFPSDDLSNKILKCSPDELQVYLTRYHGKKLEKIQHEDQMWISCKSIYYFLSWYLDNTYTLCPNIATFKYDISKYMKLTPKRLVSRSLRIEIAYSQQYKCNACGLFPIPPDFHVDHIIALEDGGQDIAENLQALCVSCHSEKTRLNRLRKTQYFAKQAETLHDNFQEKNQVFSKYFSK